MWLDDFVQASAQAVDERVLEALYARGVTDDQVALYRLGYVDRKLPDLPYPEPFLKWCYGGSKLDDMLVLPLTNALGEVKGLQFRHVEQARKGYMDFIFEKGEAVLFGLGQAMEHVWVTQRILLVEGAFDLFPMQRYFPEVVATLTAHLLDALVRVLDRLEVNDVWLGYDRDKTGTESTEKIKKAYGSKFRLYALKFPSFKNLADGKPAKDPSDFWSMLGEQEFGKFIRPLIKRTGSSLETI